MSLHCTGRLTYERVYSRVSIEYTKYERHFGCWDLPFIWNAIIRAWPPRISVKRARIVHVYRAPWPRTKKVNFKVSREEEKIAGAAAVNERKTTKDC